VLGAACANLDEVQQLRHAKLTHYRPKTVQLLRLVGTHACQRSFMDLQALAYQYLNRPRHGHGIVGNKQVRRQMKLLDHFAHGGGAT